MDKVFCVRVNLLDGSFFKESYFDFAEANSSYWEWTHCSNVESVFLEVSVLMNSYMNEDVDDED